MWEHTRSNNTLPEAFFCERRKNSVKAFWQGRLLSLVFWQRTVSVSRQHEPTDIHVFIKNGTFELQETQVIRLWHKGAVTIKRAHFGQLVGACCTSHWNKVQPVHSVTTITHGWVCPWPDHDIIHPWFQSQASPKTWPTWQDPREASQKLNEETFYSRLTKCLPALSDSATMFPSTCASRSWELLKIKGKEHKKRKIIIQVHFTVIQLRLEKMMQTLSNRENVPLRGCNKCQGFSVLQLLMCYRDTDLHQAFLSGYVLVTGWMCYTMCL